ncbi:helix-turn-helix domain-containing protein [Mesorhizobium sp. M8A.F.Ca.ET.208.01.1.1]|nr:MAG: helix-turn-helix domain-containing protein [Mesorhizobium sp.]TGQ89960.1 helix-turn-helix domain-containing protein [Mesorhizobium sp. M8A.F.Ca.ET.208.01.1.1]TGT50799.1 helix-turn-helix domain-containing protein [Mesorhizobium sp. M8A.F.Ca.ET.167.01.1.1]
MSNQAVQAQRGAMTLQQFCEWAGIGRSLAYKEISSGRLRSVKVGKRRLVIFDSAVDWLHSLPEATADR